MYVAYLIDFIHTRRDESRARVWDVVYPDLAVITSEERRDLPKIELQFLGTLRQILNQLVDRRSTMFPCRKVLERITATDLEVGVRGEIEGVVAKEGTVTVNAKKLYEVIREAPDDRVFSIRDHPSRRRGSLLDDRVNAQLTKQAIE